MAKTNQFKDQVTLFRIIRWLSNCDCAIVKLSMNCLFLCLVHLAHDKVPSLVTVYVPLLTSKEPGVVRLGP
jgi:hypothetical protein